MKTATQTIRKIDTISETLFWSLLIAIVMSAVFYMFCIQKTVRNVVQRSNIQSDMVALNSKLSESEFEYMNSVGDITLDTAHQLGFVSASQKTFVTRDRVAQNVAMR